jgi:hypothetical protein
LRGKLIGLIKRCKAGLKNLPISTSPERRIRERDIRIIGRGEDQNPPCSLNVAPTKSEDRSTSRLDDFDLLYVTK